MHFIIGHLPFNIQSLTFSRFGRNEKLNSKKLIVGIFGFIWKLYALSDRSKKQTNERNVGEN